VIETPGLRFADVFGAVDDGMYDDDPRSRH
jgi:hypothetical protein